MTTLFFIFYFLLKHAISNVRPLGRMIVWQKIFVGLLSNFPPALDRRNMNLRFKAPYSLSTL